MQPSSYPLTTATLAGWPEQAIVDRAGEDPDALIVMTTHGRGGLARWALGSVADRVLHTVSNPVLIVRASAAEAMPAEVRTVLVPLDGSDLAEMSLEHAANLAVALGAGVSLVRATHTRQYYRSRVAGPVVATGQSPESWINDLMRDDAEEATNYLTQVQCRLAAEHPEISRVETLHLLHDSPARAIIDRARPTDAGGNDEPRTRRAGQNVAGQCDRPGSAALRRASAGDQTSRRRPRTGLTFSEQVRRLPGQTIPA